MNDVPANTIATWTLDTTVNDLILSGTPIATNPQASELTLSSSQLQAIKSAGTEGATHVFTCTITLLPAPSNPVTATQSVTIRDPGQW